MGATEVFQEQPFFWGGNTLSLEKTISLRILIWIFKLGGEKLLNQDAKRKPFEIPQMRAWFPERTAMALWEQDELRLGFSAIPACQPLQSDHPERKESRRKNVEKQGKGEGKGRRRRKEKKQEEKWVNRKEERKGGHKEVVHLHVANLPWAFLSSFTFYLFFKKLF